MKRYDYATDAWGGPPPAAVGWWKSQMPGQSAARKRWAPNDVMLDFWDRLAGQPEREDMRYVLTLLLVRRRVFRGRRSGGTGRGRMCWWCTVPAVKRRIGSPPSCRGGTDRADSGGIGGPAAVAADG